MAQITIYRTADYSISNPMWIIEIVDINGDPLDFAGYTFLNAYKVEAISVDDDPNDNTATIKHRITFNPAGVPTIEDGLYYVAPGILTERFTAAETTTIPIDIPYITDMRVIYPNGEDAIIPVSDTVRSINPVTNRTLS